MSERFDLYGARSTGLADVAGRVAASVGGTAHLHDSLYRGQYYVVALEGAEDVTIQRNDVDGIREPGFPDWPILVYVDGATDAVTATLGALPGLTLLRSEI